MCQECDDNNDFFEEDGDDFLSQIPEHEREDFFTFACEQFRYMIDQATENNILYPLITEWSKNKQAAFTLACVMEQRAKSMRKDIIEDE